MILTVYRKGVPYEVLIDDADYPLVSAYTWCINQYGYVSAHDPVFWKEHKKKKSILLHRLLLNITERSIFTDHINHNKLDNRRENIRAVSRTTNNRNKKRRKFTYSSKYQGVYLTPSGKWHCRVGHGTSATYSGPFVSEEQAALMYNFLTQAFGFLSRNEVEGDYKTLGFLDQ